MKSIFITLGAVVTLTACASAPQTSRDQLTKTDDPAVVAGLFGGEVDLSETHPIGPINCPNAIDDTPFDKVFNFNPSETNVGCFYKGADALYTLYAYDQKGRDLNSELQGVVNTVLTTKKDWQVTYDEKISQTCTLSALLLGALTTNKDVNITINPDAPTGDVDGYNYAVGVMTSEKIVTIAAVHSKHEMLFKVRASSFHDKVTKEVVMKECHRTAQVMRALDASFDPSKIDKGGQDETAI